MNFASYILKSRGMSEAAELNIANIATAMTEQNLLIEETNEGIDELKQQTIDNTLSINTHADDNTTSINTHLDDNSALIIAAVQALQNSVVAEGDETQDLLNQLKLIATTDATKQDTIIAKLQAIIDKPDNAAVLADLLVQLTHIVDNTAEINQTIIDKTDEELAELIAIKINTGAVKDFVDTSYDNMVAQNCFVVGDATIPSGNHTVTITALTADVYYGDGAGILISQGTKKVIEAAFVKTLPTLTIKSIGAWSIEILHFGLGGLPSNCTAVLNPYTDFASVVVNTGQAHIQANCDLKIDWGDGNGEVEYLSTGNTDPDLDITKQIDNDGTTISIRSKDLTWFRFVSDNFIEIHCHNTESLLDLTNFCNGLTNLTTFTVDAPGFPNVTNFLRAFKNCSLLTQVKNINYQNALSTKAMFEGCTNLHDMEVINSSSCEDFSKMFKDCTSLVCLAGIDTTAQTTTANMFQNTVALIHPDAAEIVTIQAGSNWLNNSNCDETTVGNQAPVISLLGDNPDDQDIQYPAVRVWRFRVGIGTTPGKYKRGLAEIKLLTASGQNIITSSQGAHSAWDYNTSHPSYVAPTPELAIDGDVNTTGFVHIDYHRDIYGLYYFSSGEAVDSIEIIAPNDGTIPWEHIEVRYYDVPAYIGHNLVANDFRYESIVTPTIVVPMQNLNLVQGETKTFNVAVPAVSVANYTEPGYTAVDPEDGDITADVTTSGSVDLTTTGNYPITYNVQDSAGLAASKIRAVNVNVVNKEPVIFLRGDNPEELPDIYFTVSQNPTEHFPNLDYWLLYGNSGPTPGYDNLKFDNPSSSAIKSRRYVLDSDIDLTIRIAHLATATETGYLNVLVRPDAGIANFGFGVKMENGTLKATLQSGTVGNEYDVTNSPVFPIYVRMRVTNHVLKLDIKQYTQSYNPVLDDNGDVATANVSPFSNSPRLTLAASYDANNTAPVTVQNLFTSKILCTESEYSDPGYWAFDYEDGDITNLVTTSGTVDVTTAGSYTIAYSVTDSGGATGTASRVVNINHTDISPTITLQGSSYMTIPVNSTYIEPGYVAHDYEDGDLTNQVTVNGTVDTTTPGNYSLTYSVTDSSGLSTTVYRDVTVEVAANQAPTITLLGDNPYNIVEGTVWNDPGATASDPEDGNITNQIQVTGNVDVTTVGTYTLTYTVTDSGGLSDTKTRTVTVVANQAPTLTLQGDNPLIIPISTTDTDPANWVGPSNNKHYDIDAQDFEMDVLNAQIDFTLYDYYNPNTYNYYQYANIRLQGNKVRLIDDGIFVATVNLGQTVTQIDRRFKRAGNSVTAYYRLTANDPWTQIGSPIIFSQATLKVDVGGTVPLFECTTYPDYTEPGYTAIDPEDGDITANVVVTGDTVDTHTAGSYTVTYTVTDSSGASATVDRTVLVISNPVITLLGDNPYSLTQNSTWTDPGATAVDFAGTDISNDIVTNGTVDSATVGTYNITYNVTDSHGFHADTVTRVVDVTASGSGGGGGGGGSGGGGGGSSNNPPVVTLNGNTNVTVLVGSTWNDPGATAIDPEEGTLNVVVGGDTVDTATEGTYVVTYTATDSQGLSDTKNRTITVSDGSCVGQDFIYDPTEYNDTDQTDDYKPEDYDICP